MPSEQFIGFVVQSCPELGLAVVASERDAKNGTKYYIGTLPYASCDTGVAVRYHVREGETVLCTVADTGRKDVYITSVVNATTTDANDCLRQRAYYNVSVQNHQTFVEADNPTFLTVAEQVFQQTLTVSELQAKMPAAHSVDIDAIPGDYDIVDAKATNGIHIGSGLSQLRGDCLSYVDASGRSKCVRRVGDRLEDHTLLSMDISAYGYKVHNTAISMSEAVGLASGPIMTGDPDTESLMPVDEYAIPLYRLQASEGAAVDGKESIVVCFPFDEQSHKADTEPTILAKSRVSLMGELSKATALGSIQIKTPSIIGLHQLGYGETSTAHDSGEFDDLLEPYNASDDNESEDAYDDGADSASEEERISDAALNKIAESLLSSDYVDKLIAVMRDRGFKVSTPEATLQEKKLSKAPTPGGASIKQEYDLPASIQLEDPVTGEKKSYFASTSFIAQEPDGSILICDGYGSEIRMSRGNIYISPALDLFCRPGRDMFSMVPRHLSFDAQDTITIKSATSMYACADYDMKIAGGAANNGVVVLESLAEAEAGKGAGVLLKSKGGASIIGNDIYIGRHHENSAAEGTVQTPDRSGSIVIDACDNGVLYTRAAATTAKAKQQTIISVTDDAGTNGNSAVILAGGLISIVGQEVDMPAILNMQTFEYPQNVEIPNGTETTVIGIGFNDNPSVLVAGDVQVNGNFVAGGDGRFNGQFAASAVAAKNVSWPIENADEVFEPLDVYTTEPLANLGTPVADSVAELGKTIYQDAYVHNNVFYFPADYGVDASVRVPGMRWQSISADMGALNEPGLRWAETFVPNPVGNPTACYPGYDVWQGADISFSGYTVRKLKDYYITNSKR